MNLDQLTPERLEREKAAFAKQKAIIAAKAGAPASGPAAAGG